MSNYEYLSVQQIVDSRRYPFTVPMIRYYLLHRHKNGLEKAVRKIGKRLFLRTDLLNTWIEDQSSKRGS